MNESLSNLSSQVAIRFQPVVFDDWERLLAWRNDPLTRQFSFQGHVISPGEHQAWLRVMLERPDRHLFLVVVEGQSVGVVRQDEEKTYSTISWTISPEHRGKGYGKQMLKAFSDQLPGELRARIKSDNAASIRMALYAGFTLLEENAQEQIYRRSAGGCRQGFADV